MQQLTNGTLLQGGKYKIERVLGQGGFGITYLAEQVMLGRKVAVKEFFMKELCERNDATSFVTLGTESGRDTVNRFRDKFLKEARNIARLNHPHIVRIIDVFEENGTAYYVMEYAENGSLADKVKKEGYLSEPIATQYILQVADALDYVHQRKMNHLDVKPANIMLNDNGDAVLIDFGLSKQYDAVTGNQTSTTPVGISEGYAPMEQYKQGGVGEFSPETDIYALGATFYKLLTGITPPSASDVMEDGLSVDILKSKGVSDNTIAVICKAMESRKKERMKNVKDFISKLNEQTISRNDANILKEETNITEAEKRKKEVNKSDTDDATVSIDSEETTYINKPSENNEETEFVKHDKGTKTTNKGESLKDSKHAKSSKPIEQSKFYAKHTRIASIIIWAAVILLMGKLILALKNHNIYYDGFIIDISYGTMRLFNDGFWGLSVYIDLFLSYLPFVLIFVLYSQSLGSINAKIMSVALFIMLILLPLGYYATTVEPYDRSFDGSPQCLTQVCSPLMRGYNFCSGWSGYAHGWLYLLCMCFILLWGIIKSEATICKIVLSSIFIPLLLATVTRIIAENWPNNGLVYIGWAAYLTSYLPIFAVAYDYYNIHVKTKTII